MKIILMKVSTFILSDDKKEIAIAFNGLNAVISRWEFSTQLPISKLILDFLYKNINIIIKYFYYSKLLISCVTLI